MQDGTEGMASRAGVVATSKAVVAVFLRINIHRVSRITRCINHTGRTRGASITNACNSGLWCLNSRITKGMAPRFRCQGFHASNSVQDRRVCVVRVSSSSNLLLLLSKSLSQGADMAGPERYLVQDDLISIPLEGSMQGLSLSATGLLYSSSGKGARGIASHSLETLSACKYMQSKPLLTDIGKGTTESDNLQDATSHLRAHQGPLISFQDYLASFLDLAPSVPAPPSLEFPKLGH